MPEYSFAAVFDSDVTGDISLAMTSDSENGATSAWHSNGTVQTGK
jgi:hypothetical protein